MTNLYDLTLAQLRDLLAAWGEKPFRARQIWEWLYQHKAQTFAQMSNLPAPLRQRLEAETTLGKLTPASEIFSNDGYTVKRLFQLSDGQLIESVLMDYDDGRHTACISTQAGCAMGCVFCATGQMGTGAGFCPPPATTRGTPEQRCFDGHGRTLPQL